MNELNREVVRLVLSRLVSIYFLSHNTIYSTSSILFMRSAEQAQTDRSWNGERDREQKKEHVGSLAYVEDEVLVLGLEREAAAEVDAPHQHQHRRHRRQRVRRVRERRRLHAQPGRGHLARALLPPLPPPPSPGLYGGGSRSPPATDSSSDGS